MTHHLLQDGKAHARAGHVSAEGVSKAMSIGHRQHRASSPVPEQAPKSCRGHRASALLALEHDEESRLGTLPWPFQRLVLAKSARKNVGQGQRAITLPLPSDSDPAVAEDNVT